MATGTVRESTDPELEATAWDLEPLVDGEGKEGVERRLTEALERASASERCGGGRAHAPKSAASATASAVFACPHPIAHPPAASRLGSLGSAGKGGVGFRLSV